jgi:hypothetical protein
MLDNWRGTETHAAACHMLDPASRHSRAGHTDIGRA